MVEQYHGRDKTKASGTGGFRRFASDKKLALYGGAFTATKVGEKDVRQIKKGRGSTAKVKLKHVAFANVLLKDGTSKKAKIRNVLETRNNRHYARQNIITKGAIIDTELGKVQVTNRVGQDGVVNGKLL